jgi:hypothetical protein
VAAALSEFADAVRADRDALDRLAPPPDIAQEHQRFVGILLAEAESYDCAAQAIQEAAHPSNPGSSTTEMQLCLQSFYDDEVYYFGGEDFLRVVKRGGYDLGPDLESDVHPDVPHRFLGDDN